MSALRRGAAIALPCAALLATGQPVSAQASRSAAGAGRHSVLIAFIPAAERQLASVGGLSIGILSAAQGIPSRAQLLLDLSQGARVSSTAYATSTPPPLSLERSGAGAVVTGWEAARRRAEDAPQLLQPGLLASGIPGGAAYVGGEGGSDLDAVAAAGRDGRIAAFSLGSAASLLARVAASERGHALVVADLAVGSEGVGELRTLISRRAPDELVIVLQRVGARSAEALIWAAAAGLAGGGGRELSSQSTNQRGLIASFDVAPTVFAALGLPVPADVSGKPIRTEGRLDSSGVRGLESRLRAITGRRLKALGFLLCTWALLLAGAACRRDRRTQAWALRVGALGLLWAPVVTLLPAALEPAAGVEYGLIAGVCLALGALTDALLAWPRAPLAIALVTVAVLAVDALAGTQLLMRSLLGPDPILGARFYGIGNELKSGLAVLVAAGVAAALYPCRRGPRPALAMASAGALLALFEGSARLGAGVGGVILVSFGFALAAVMLLPGALTRKRALLVLCAPFAGLVVLAGVDLASARGASHFTGSVLHARSAGELRDVIVRRYRAAWDELGNEAMPFATTAALAGAALAVHRRERLLAVVDGDPGWLAALAGGLAAGVVGALVEDSGPVLLVVACFSLLCVISYLQGRPSALRRGQRATHWRHASTASTASPAGARAGVHSSL